MTKRRPTSPGPSLRISCGDQLVSEAKQLYCVGIGGIGVSSLAQYYLAQGWRVAGSDAKESDTTRQLAALGARIVIGTDPAQAAAADLVVHTTAVDVTHPEVAAARAADVTVQDYPAALGALTRDHYTIVIAGTAGKSTTTAMVALILMAAGEDYDPTVIIGTKLRELNWANFRLGRSRYLVIEADEYKGAFWHYHPAVAVVLNVDADHLDFYHDIDDIMSSFRRFLGNVAAGGTIILNGRDAHARALGEGLTGDHQVVMYDDRQAAHRALQVPGVHNQSNAEAAARAAAAAGVPAEVIERALAAFTGTWRRFERVAEGIYSDYAHHPAKIEAAIEAAREMFPAPEHKIVVVFQPDGKHRLNSLFERFATAFEQADETYIVPTVLKLGRERDEGRGSEELVATIQQPNVHFAPSVEEAYAQVAPQVRCGQPGDKTIAIFMGSGDIDKRLRALLDRDIVEGMGS